MTWYIHYWMDCRRAEPTDGSHASVQKDTSVASRKWQQLFKRDLDIFFKLPRLAMKCISLSLSLSRRLFIIIRRVSQMPPYRPSSTFRATIIHLWSSRLFQNNGVNDTHISPALSMWRDKEDHTHTRWINTALWTGKQQNEKSEE